jgi:phosphoribosylformimino-5-aminoimidazole carboxamide ribotide isomerase
MQVIPVIDLMDGQAVRAVAGERDRYRPIATPLARSSDPCALAEGYLALHPFDTLYVADLDAILGRGDNFAALRRLARAFPAATVWLDAGGHQDFQGPNVETVIGSENLSASDPCPDFSGAARAILSLDFGPSGFLGPAGLPTAPHLWPRRLLVMTLARIGGGAGPDWARLAEVTALAGERQVLAAGGVRDAADLIRLTEMGVAGALVASALHDGRLGPADLAALG